MMSVLKSKNGSTQNDEHWIPLSDLMSGLMMLFMLIAVMYIIEHRSILKIKQCEAEVLQANVAAVKRLTEVYERAQKELRDALELRLRSDLPQWGAHLGDDFTIRFSDPKTLFPINQSILSPRFREILSQFLPRYLDILYEARFRDLISEIRIEGHTSSIWSGLSSDAAYLRNMELSQSRTRATLEYSLSLPRDPEQQKWLFTLLTANGLSSSRPILNPNGIENIEASQRVEFRIRTNAETRLLEVIQAADGDWLERLVKCREAGSGK